MGNNHGGNYKSNVGSVDIGLDFEIDPNNGQEEIRSFGYYFNKLGECRSVKDDTRVGKFPSQKEYEDFGSALEKFIFYLLKTQYKMQEIIISSKKTNDSSDDDNDVNDNNDKHGESAKNDANKESTKNDDDNNQKEKEKETKKPKKKTAKKESKIASARCFFSPKFEEQKALLLLIPGSGAVRAGQWARSICINDNLAAGCMYPFIAAAYQREWGVALFDPNGRTDEGRVYSEEHVLHVFDKYIEPVLSSKNCSIEHVFMVCHSAGGYAATQLINNRSKYLLNRIRGVAGTDTFFGRPKNARISDVFNKYIANWVASRQKVGYLLTNNTPKRLSSGHSAHEYTSASAFKHIFSYFDAHLNIHNSTPKNDEKNDTNNDANVKSETNDANDAKDKCDTSDTTHTSDQKDTKEVMKDKNDEVIDTTKDSMEVDTQNKETEKSEKNDNDNKMEIDD